MLQLDLNDQQLYCLLSCSLYQRVAILLRYPVYWQWHSCLVKYELIISLKQEWNWLIAWDQMVTQIIDLSPAHLSTTTPCLKQNAIHMRWSVSNENISGQCFVSLYRSCFKLKWWYPLLQICTNRVFSTWQLSVKLWTNSHISSQVTTPYL